MNVTSARLALGAALLLTLLASLAPKYWPQRVWQVFPGEQPWFALYGDGQVGGPSHSEWIDDQPGHWRCRVQAQGSFVYCGVNVLTSENNQNGVDVRVYDKVRLKVRPLSEPRKLRFFLRHYDERYANPEDANSAQFLQFSLRTQDLQQELVIHLSDFTVADWWLNQRDIPLELTRPAFSNIIAIGLDYWESLPPGEHDLILEKIEFVGTWITATYWYLGIGLAWLVGILALVTVRLLRLRRITWRARDRLQALTSQHEDLKQEKNRYEHLSSHDALTGTYNRYGFEKEANKRLVENQCAEAALILMDIDHFKQINDTRGHNTGDDIIVRFAQLVAEHTRAQDILCRWGGEEFLLLCPNTHLDNAFALAEKIRQIVNTTQFSPTAPLQVTASFGVSQIGPGEEFLYALERVDQALYQAKELGRNCTVRAELPPRSSGPTV